MALLDSEIVRIKAELGYNVETIGAYPYIGHSALFEQVIAVYTQAGATTTSSTAVTAATTATPVTLTLTSATGFSLLDQVVVDVDARQERGTVSAVSGSTIVVQLLGTHSGVYPITVEGGESLIRDILRQLRLLGDPAGQLARATATAGINSIDKGDVVFFGRDQGSRLKEIQGLREYWREELAATLGVPYFGRKRGGGSSVSLY